MCSGWISVVWLVNAISRYLSCWVSYSIDFTDLQQTRPDGALLSSSLIGADLHGTSHLVIIVMYRILRHSCFVFQSDTSVTITCANGKWNKQISCEPVDCGLPDKYHVHPAHFMFPEGTTYGKKSTFQCREPAQLVGECRIHTCACRSTYAVGRMLREKEMYESASAKEFLLYLAPVFVSRIL